MQANVNQPHVNQSQWQAYRQELHSLAFITRGGNWLFLLLSRLAEPLMFLSVLYVIAETILPALFVSSLLMTLSRICLIILNLAPEIILPGCFMQAGLADKSQAWKFKSMGVVFLLLTFVTLASFIWQFPAGVVNVILFFRCSAGVLYSLLVRMTPQGSLEDVLAREQASRMVDQWTNQLQMRQTEFLVQVQSHIQQTVHQTLMDNVTLRLLPQFGQAQNEVNQAVQMIPATVQREVQHVVSGQVQTAVGELVQATLAAYLPPLLDSHEQQFALRQEALDKGLTERMEALSAAVSTLARSMPKRQEQRSQALATPLPSACRQSDKTHAATRPLTLVPSPPVDRATLPSSEQEAHGPVQIRVANYLREQYDQGLRPSIADIMAACDVSKGSAIKYRRAWVQDPSSVEAQLVREG